MIIDSVFFWEAVDTKLILRINGVEVPVTCSPVQFACTFDPLHVQTVCLTAQLKKLPQQQGACRRLIVCNW